MKKRALAILLPLAFSWGLMAAPTPEKPKFPLKFASLDVGEVAAIGGKASVLIRVAVHDDVECGIEVSTADKPLYIAEDQIEPLAIAIEKGSNANEVRSRYATPFLRATINSSKVQVEALGGNYASIEIDADNAPTFAKLLRRAASNSAWIKERLAPLTKK